MSAVDATPSPDLQGALPGPFDRGTAAPADRADQVANSAASVEIIGPTSSAWADLIAQRGRLWREWCDLWNSLAVSERDPATHPAWLTAWLAAHSESDRDVRVFVCRDAAQFLAVVPLEVVDRGGRRTRLRAPADVPLEGASLAVRKGGLSPVLAALLRTPIDGGQQPQMLEFECVDESHHLLQQRTLSCRIEQAGARSVIEIPEGEADPMERFGSNLRGNLRKARNKLQRHADARIDELTTPAEVAAAIERLAEVESRSWKAEGGTDFASDQRTRAFFATALPALAAEGRALAHVLFADGRDIGAQLSVRFGGELLVHKIAFDAKYSPCAPGNLLLKRVLEDASRNGIRRVNLVTSLPWHQRWKPTRAATYRVQVFPNGLRGVWTRATRVPARDRLRDWSERLGLLPQIRSWRSRAQRIRGI